MKRCYCAKDKYHKKSYSHLGELAANFHREKKRKKNQNKTKQKKKSALKIQEYLMDEECAGNFFLCNSSL